MADSLKKGGGGQPQASIRCLVVDPASEREAATAVQTNGDKANYLDTTWYVAAARDAALRPAIVLRTTVFVDGAEMVLPHDKPKVLADFVECTYVLHGWKAVLEISGDLQQMLFYAANPAGYERRLRFVPGGKLLGEGDLAHIDVEDPVAQDRLSSMSRRIGIASVAQISEWQTAFESAFAELRLRILRVAQSFEERALRWARESLSESMDEVVSETTGYFQWHNRDTAVETLRRGLHLEVQAKQDAVMRLRDRLTRLMPLAQAVKDRDSEMAWYVAKHAVIHGKHLPEPYATEQKEKIAAVERALAEYGAELATTSAQFPVLYRFDVHTMLDAATASDEELGVLIFTRLSKTFQAAEHMWRELSDHRPAKEVSEKNIRSGTLPEKAPIGDKAKDSIWSYSRMVDAAARITPIDDAELAECAANNVANGIRGHANDEATLSLLKGVSMGGLTMALMCVCPPAGLALDAGLAMADIMNTVKEYNDQSEAALCSLNPRKSFSEVSPSAVPIVMAIAGLAMVAI